MTSAEEISKEQPRDSSTSDFPERIVERHGGAVVKRRFMEHPDFDQT